MLYIRLKIKFKNAIKDIHQILETKIKVQKKIATELKQYIAVLKLSISQ